MADDITRDLVVYVQSISYSGSTSITLLSEPISIFIDSTDPNLWLPESACDAVEKAFDLTLDEDSDLYLVNDTHHTDLLDSNAEVTFRLSDVSSGGDTVTITLPYEAFALTAKYPLVNESSYYFPIKRAANSTQYTLGRTFLQEAYLSADYEQGVFNVSACSWNEDAEESIITISSKGSDSSTRSSSLCSSSSGSGGAGFQLSRGAVAGIAIAALVSVVILAVVLLFFIRRHRQKTSYKSTPPAPDGAVLSGPVQNPFPPEPSSSSNDPSPPQGTYWSPDTVFRGNSDSYNGVSSGNGVQNDNSVDGRGLEIDGQEVRPVYHELGGVEIEKSVPDRTRGSVIDERLRGSNA